MNQERQLRRVCKRYKGNLKRWYEYNYKFIGSEWLIRALDEIFKDKDRITFISPSANQGRYEEDAFLALSAKYKSRLNFVLSDLCGDEIYEDKEELKDYSNWLLYLKGKQDAEALVYREEVDVILDNKGAIWTKLNHGLLGRKQSTLSLLRKYAEYLRDDDSVLLIDCYDVNQYHFLKELRNPIKYKLFRGLIMNKSFSDFEEKSTYYYLNKRFEQTSYFFELLDPMVIKAGTQSMRLAKISKRNLMEFIESIEKNKSKIFFHIERC